MLCDHCHQNPAMLFLSETINGTTTQCHLCPTCAKKLYAQNVGQTSTSAPNTEDNAAFHVPGGMDSFMAMPWMQTFFNQTLPSSEKEARAVRPKTCPECGMTWADFQQNGLLGCAACYTTFRDALPDLIHRLHGHSQHVGKTVDAVPVPLAADDPLTQLRSALHEAVQNEAFEEAATLRDRIRALEEGGHTDDTAESAG